jgi:hypothetical protein
VLSLHAVAPVAADDAWAVGGIKDQTGVTRALHEHWDGTAWTIVPGAPSASPTVEGLTGVSAVSGSDVFAAPFEHWDGSAWSVASNMPFGRDVVALSPGEAWTVGRGRQYVRAALWDGTAWSEVPVIPYGELEKVTATRPHDAIWAIGGRTTDSVPLVIRLCPVRLSDAGFTPTSATSYRGGGVAWSLPPSNGQAHSVTDASALGLFDSGLRAPGTSFTTTLIAAGTYSVRDTTTGKTGTIKVPLDTSAKSGLTSTSFTLTPPVGYAVDVQIKRPGSSSYVNWQKRTTQPSGAFVPDAGPGSYSFRARYRNTRNFAASGWSSAVTITAS